ncbi:sce7726 family protein [Sphingobium chungbukense]|uniref:sce7726 family protein n=1 Tax=Sphingobium chungbukense TaxID=56193 RepID=UPI0018DD7B26|nr:sce7726 family protein [Sphingobium chungbukense]
MALRDRDIRIKLTEWLATEYSYDPTTVICHELAIPRPSARIDLAVVNGVLAGFEIKSELDTLSRLPRQIASFSCIFERATLVTTPRHAAQARSLLPDWWGILVLDEKLTFRRLKRGRQNTKVSCKHALHLLTRKELYALAALNRCTLSRVLKKAAAIEAISEEVRHSEVMHGVREALKGRLSQQIVKVI